MRCRLHFGQPILGCNVTAIDAAVMMARIACSEQLGVDSFNDLVGYSAIAAGLHEVSDKTSE